MYIFSLLNLMATSSGIIKSNVMMPNFGVFVCVCVYVSERLNSYKGHK